MIFCRKHTRYIILFFLLCFCGCASVQDRMKQVDQGGIERTYAYPYKKVFYACEDVLPRMNWHITESDQANGYIFAIPNSEASISSAGIRIKSINENRTSIKMLEFHSLAKNAYKDFFDNLDTLLTRDQ